MQSREDKYTIDQSVEGDWTITIFELWSIGHLTFKEPLKIRVFLDDIDNYALAAYDFGMECTIPTSEESNWLYDYAGNNVSCDPLKTVFSTIKFDLMHAFFHYDGDPNYGPTHWALRGWLRNRCEAEDDSDAEDAERNL